MPSEVLSTNHQGPGKGLPPVTPPSGKFIIQLFLVPGLIVAVAVFILLGFSWLVGGDESPDALLGRLEDPNPKVRWRAANEFVQRVKRDDRLASNPQVALRLTAMLRRAVDQLDGVDRSLPEAERLKEKQNLQEKRKDVEFLSPCLGNLMLPTGAPLLAEIARKGKGTDVKTTALLRRQAVWALANLGENLKRFQKLPSAQADDIREELQAASVGKGESAEWARLSYRYLEGTQKNIGVIQALAECAKADDPFLRTLVAHALTFWEGDAEENALAEKTLLALSRDDGHGDRIEIGETD